MQEFISANALSKVIKSNLDSLDYTMTTGAITRYLERITKKRVSFAALILAMLQAGFAAVPNNTSIRFLPMRYVSTIN